MKLKYGFQNYGVNDAEKNHRNYFLNYSPKLLFKEREAVRSPARQIAIQMPEQPKEEVENKKHMLGILSQ